MAKKSILILTPFIPYPLNSGGRIAQFQVNKHLQDHFDVTLVFVLKRRQDAASEQLRQILPNIKIVPFYYEGLINELDFLTFYNRLPEFFMRFLGNLYFKIYGKTSFDHVIKRFLTLFKSKSNSLPRTFIAFVNNLVVENKYDFVQVEFHQLISLSKYLPKDVCKIFIDHEIRYVREERELNVLSFKSDFFKKIYNANKKFELECLEKYDMVCTLSANDQQELKKYLKKPNIYASPVPINLNDATYPFENTQSLVFLGGEDHFPNKEGLDWFIRKCWPTIQSKYPFLKLAVIGKWHEHTMNAYCKTYQSIKFHGFVKDLSTVLANSIFIVPVRIGSGIRIKILDAVSAGIPFVTTSIGVEGLNFEHSKSCLVGDTDQEFILNIEKIINNPDFGKALANNAKQILSKDYSYDKLVQLRLDMYNQVVL